MKAAAKTQKPKRQEEQANFVSWRFALLCGCILLALGFLLARTRSVVTSYLPGYAGERGRHAFSSRSASFHLPRHDY